MDIEKLRQKIECLNEKIRPIAERPVAFGPDLVERLAALPNPLDEAGVRDEAEETLRAAVEEYLRGSSEERQRLREIFRKYHAFAWAATLAFPADSTERLRRHLAHFSMLDQHPDYRDALLWLDDLRKSPYFEAVRDEIAALSGDATRNLLSGR